MSTSYFIKVCTAVYISIQSVLHVLKFTRMKRQHLALRVFNLMLSNKEHPD